MLRKREQIKKNNCRRTRRHMLKKNWRVKRETFNCPKHDNMAAFTRDHGLETWVWNNNFFNHVLWNGSLRRFIKRHGSPVERNLRLAGHPAPFSKNLFDFGFADNISNLFDIQWEQFLEMHTTTTVTCNIPWLDLCHDTSILTYSHHSHSIIKLADNTSTCLKSLTKRTILYNTLEGK